MAARKTATPKPANAEKEEVNETPEEVDEKAETEENTTEPEENAESEEKDPLAVEIDNLPHVEDKVSSILLQETAEFLVDFDRHHKIFIENSLDNDAIQHAADTHTGDAELTEMREKRDETQKQISDLEAQIERLEGVLKAQKQSLWDRAEKVLSETVSEKDRNNAKAEKEAISGKIRINFGTIKQRIPNWQENYALQTWFRETNLRLHGNATTATPQRSVESRRENEKIREWAKLNGFRVKDRGRLPDTVVHAYRVANPSLDEA